MKTGKYKSPSGEIHEVIQVDEENKRVECNYGDYNHWWDETEYSTWELVSGEENLITEPEIDAGEKVLDYQEPETPPSVEEEKLSNDINEDLEKRVESEEKGTISEVQNNPITDEKPRRKRTPTKKK